MRSGFSSGVSRSRVRGRLLRAGARSERRRLQPRLSRPSCASPSSAPPSLPCVHGPGLLPCQRSWRPSRSTTGYAAVPRADALESSLPLCMRPAQVRKHPHHQKSFEKMAAESLVGKVLPWRHGFRGRFGGQRETPISNQQHWAIQCESKPSSTETASLSKRAVYRLLGAQRRGRRACAEEGVHRATHLNAIRVRLAVHGFLSGFAPLGRSRPRRSTPRRSSRRAAPFQQRPCAPRAG